MFVERLYRNIEKVGGSSPSSPTNRGKHMWLMQDFNGSQVKAVRLAASMLVKVLGRTRFETSAAD